MKIIIYGTGGVGGYFGARLAQAGNNVVFIARGKHLEAIQKNGLQLKSIKGNHTVFPANATDDVTSITNPDLIIIATKTWQLEEVAKKCEPILSSNTIVLSLLNGADNAQKLTKIIPKKHVIGGLCKIVSKIEDYGIINHLAIEPYIGFGELDNTKTNRVLELQKVFNEAGIFNQIPNDIEATIWSKFLFITTISALGGLTRSPIGILRSMPELRKLMLSTAEEIVAIAKAKNININQETIEQSFKIIDNLPFETTASLQRDIMSGKPSELESQVGAVHKMGKELEIETPVNSFIYHCLLPLENKSRKEP
jgi:2-dehydropantoate 2-reductase